MQCSVFLAARHHSVNSAALQPRPEIVQTVDMISCVICSDAAVAFDIVPLLLRWQMSDAVITEACCAVAGICYMLWHCIVTASLKSHGSL